MDAPRRLSTGIRHLWTGSIRRRLILGISALLVLVMSAFVADLVSRQADYAYQDHQDEAKALAQTLAANSVSWVLASDLAGLQEVIQAVKRYPDLRYAMILTRDGKVLAHTDPRLPGRYARDAVSDSLLRAPPAPQLLVSNSSTVDFAAPIRANGALIGWARASLGQDRVKADLRAIARDGLIYAALAIALGTLLAVLITRGLTRDLARLVWAARRIGAGEHGVRAAIGREDELGALGGAFDRMSLDLDRAVQALREREETIGELVAKSPLAMIVSSGTDQRVELVNEKFTGLFGYTMEDMPDVAHWWALAYPEAQYREKIEAIWSERAAHAIETKGEIESMEATVRCKDGSVREIEFRMASVGARNLVTFFDLTERKQAEAVRTQLAAIVQSSHDAIIGKDLEGVITSWNPGAEKIFGYRAEEVLGRPASVLAPEDRKDEILRLLGRAGRGEAAMSFETVRLRKDGERIEVELDLSPIRDAAGRITGVSTIARDITEKKRAERALHSVNRALKAVSSCNMALIHATDEMQLLNEICRIVVNTGGYRLAWVGYAERDAGKTVRPVAHSGYEPGYMERANITWADDALGRGPVGIAIRSGQIQVVQDVMRDPRFEPWRANAERLGYGAVLVAPLVSGFETLGALSIHAEGADAFDAGEIALLGELAADMAFGIVTLRTRGAHERGAARLQRSMEATIQVIAGTVEMRDPYTAGHQVRVAELATAIARGMGLPEEQAQGIRLAGMVHDLGKIHIPAEILSRPGKLSPIERELIKSHSEAGYDILKGVDFPWPIAQTVYQHHERLDGSGYPRGLKGDEILLEARVLMVADVIEAMASHRPYRPAIGIDLALEEVAANAGKCYDADVARVCIALFREKAFAFK